MRFAWTVLMVGVGLVLTSRATTNGFVESWIFLAIWMLFSGISARTIFGAAARPVRQLAAARVEAGKFTRARIGNSQPADSMLACALVAGLLGLARAKVVLENLKRRKELA